MYPNGVYDWPMSLTPTNGESGDLCKKNLQRKEKDEAIGSVSVCGERSKSLLHVLPLCL